MPPGNAPSTRRCGSDVTGFALTAPGRTIFGRGTRASAADEIAAMGKRVLLVRGRSVAWVDDLVRDLKARGCTVAPLISVGEPDLDAVRAGVALARDHGAEVIVSVGGGAAIDLGKALSGLARSEGDPADFLELGPSKPRHLSTPLPFVAMPTTAGTGAEATRNAVIGVPEQQAKISLRDPRLVPDLCLIDPCLTDGAPKALTLATGLDAITQLIESYLSCRANPVTDALCHATIPEAIAALFRLMQAEDTAGRDTMSRAAYLSGLALANSGLGIVHGLASVIGGRGGAHGDICGRLLAPALVVNRGAIAHAGQDISRVEAVDQWLAEGLGGGRGEGRGEGSEVLRRFVDDHGLPVLADLGMADGDVADIAAMAQRASSTRANPVELSVDDIIRILESA